MEVIENFHTYPLNINAHHQFSLNMNKILFEKLRNHWNETR